jgi:S-adenosylmethionine:diacylglycerol 3-amino-3-carboxypropyl transferase
MQGYILNINKVKDEDLIVSILTESKLKTLYRFYGARHATINLGYKIDFEAVASSKSTISMLREVLPLSAKWMLENQRFFIWQQYIKLMFKHLKDVIEIDPFYFYLLEETSTKMQMQNPKRVVVESYLEILAYEGRLHDDFKCFICDTYIEENIVLARSFLPAHKVCVFGEEISRGRVKSLFDSKSTLYLEDEEVDYLWRILQEGF